MIVGLLTLELFIGEAESLKDKRRVLKSIIDKMKAKFNISIAEVGKQDSWQFSTVGLSCVSNEPSHVHQMLSAAVKFVENQGTVEILEIHTELL